MSILKCKMCGGNLNIEEEYAVAECEFCCTKQTVPKSVNDVKIAELFNKANEYRSACEFDRAARIYEQILEESEKEAEAYWGLILCEYGIEYVNDPKTGKKIPTCHKASYEPITTEINYKNALKYANVVQKDLYEKEASQIDELQKNILTLANNEDPYDVFICYKETDETGRRTKDSVIANDIYYQLTNMGYKVFYAAITLEDKLGSAYEPYIFAALNSARIMLAIGTNKKYFNAVWVKNEWSRFLKIISTDRKKVLVPCYRDMDAYELPEEFAHLQALDMSKIGFINDIERLCERIIGKKQTTQPAPSNQGSGANPTVGNLIKRIFAFIEEGDKSSALEYCEKVLDIDLECGEAYLGKLMLEQNVKTVEDFSTVKIDTSSRHYKSIMRYGTPELKAKVEQFLNNYNEGIYKRAVRLFNEERYAEAKKVFLELEGYRDSSERAAECDKGMSEAKLAKTYSQAVELYDKCSILVYERKAVSKEVIDALSKAYGLFLLVQNYKDGGEYLKKSNDLLKEGYYIYNSSLVNQGKFKEARAFFEKNIDYKDSKALLQKCDEGLALEATRETYRNAVRLYNKNRLFEALQHFKTIADYEDSDEYIAMIEQNIGDLKEQRRDYELRNLKEQQIDLKKKVDALQRKVTVAFQAHKDCQNDLQSFEKNKSSTKKIIITDIVLSILSLVCIPIFVPLWIVLGLVCVILTIVAAKRLGKSPFLWVIITNFTVVGLILFGSTFLKELNTTKYQDKLNKSKADLERAEANLRAATEEYEAITSKIQSF